MKQHLIIKKNEKSYKKEEHTLVEKDQDYETYECKWRSRALLQTLAL